MSAAAALPVAPTAVPASADAPVIDRENPWPGLVSFPEAAEAYFNGRDAERDDLLRLIRRETLTLLYGLSGLGKSSLLNAGLFPLLRQEHFLPVYVRLDHAETSPPHDEQVRGALLAECAARGVEAPAARQGESVWELLHRADGGFWDAKNYPVTPVLVIDQFEEIFTLGMSSPARRERSRRFMAELGDLIDNRPPDALVRRLEGDPDAAAAYAFAHPGCKVVVSMREDFLPELGRLGEHTRSTFQNYLRLLRMRGDTAVEAILTTGGALVDRDVARAIVYFLAKVPADRHGTTDLATVEVEPALLSLVCRELNQRRRQEGLAKMDLGLLDVSQTAILTKFYRESFDGMKPGVRLFVEEELLTETGYRDAAALDDALRLPDVTADAIDALVARRLIRKEERFGTPRVELTHDVLTDVVRESRDRRRADEALTKLQTEIRTRRQKAAVLAAVGLVVVFGLFWAFWGATETRRKMHWVQAYSDRLASQGAVMDVQADSLRVERASAAVLQDRLKIQQILLATAQAQVARQRDTMQQLVAATNAAHQRAQLLEREALVSSEIGDYHLDVAGRLLRRRVAETAAADSVALHAIAMAERVRRQAEEAAAARLRQGEELEQAVTTVLCRDFSKESAEHRLRVAVESALVGRPLCTMDGRGQREPSQRTDLVQQGRP